jgi:glycosyltransferase involved in cell wall biosynthesis
MPMPVKLTLLMPVWNAAPYVREALASVLAQDMQEYELLIIDDGSTDETPAIIASFDDARIRVIRQENAGVAAALNTGLAMAKGTCIARFDADDICLPGRLSAQFSFLEQHPDYILVGSDADYMDEEGNFLFHYNCPAHTDEEIKALPPLVCPFIHSAVMYRKDVVLEAGGYSLQAHNFEDHLLWRQLVPKGRCCNLKQSLIKVRFNPGSVTLDEKWRGARFCQLKAAILQRASITTAEGQALLSIIQNQSDKKYKQAAYHGLCGKKYLVNQYHPAKARKHFARAIRLKPARVDNYGLYLLSFLPAGWIRRMYQIKNKKQISDS